MKNICSILFILIISNAYAQKNIFDVSRSGSLEELTSIYNKTPNAINEKNDSGYTPLILACYNNNIEVVSFLIDKVDDINGSSDYGSPLMAAAVKGYVEIIQMLLKNNADPNITDAKGTTALHYAAMFQNIEIAEILMLAKAKSNLKNNVGKTALDFAISTGNDKLINILKNN